MNFVNLKKNHQKLRVDILIGWVLFSRMDPVFNIHKVSVSQLFEIRVHPRKTNRLG